MQRRPDFTPEVIQQDRLPAKDTFKREREAAFQAGPLMVRHIIDGHEVMLPADAKLAKRLTSDDGVDLSEPLSGTF